jgi:hypothetical protein
MMPRFSGDTVDRNPVDEWCGRPALPLLLHRPGSFDAEGAWPGDREGDPPLPSLDGPDLAEFTERILAMSGKEHGRVFAESPLARPGRKGVLRNLCVALGNS